jgi:hypothetical protein
MNKNGLLAHEEEPLIRQNNDIIWHYTTSDVFALMADGKTGLYATDHRFLSDSDELSYGSQFLHEVLLKMKNDPCQFCKDAKIELQDASKLPADFPSEKIIDVCLATWERFENYKVTLYTTCFSHEPDSLYQWRSYTPDGGLAIGFSLAELKDYFSSITAFPLKEYQDFTLYTPQIKLNLDGKDTPVPYYAVIGKCVYDSVEQRKMVYRTIVTAHDKQENSTDKQESSNYFSPILACIALFKNSSFWFEKEERIVFCGPLLNKSLEIIAGKPRVAIPGYNKDVLAQKIRGIFVSPHGKKRQNHILAQVLLSKNDIECNVFDSRSTYIGG